MRSPPHSLGAPRRRDAAARSSWLSSPRGAARSRSFAQLAWLYEIHLDGNELGGQVPSEFADRLAVLSLADNAFEYGLTPLSYAATGGHCATIEVLLAAGADIHAVTKSGQTALMRAASGGHVEAVKLLLAKGADARIETVEGGLFAAHKTALDHAREGHEEGHATAAALLVAHMAVRV